MQRVCGKSGAHVCISVSAWVETGIARISISGGQTRNISSFFFFYIFPQFVFISFHNLVLPLGSSTCTHLERPWLCHWVRLCVCANKEPHKSCLFSDDKCRVCFHHEQDTFFSHPRKQEKNKTKQKQKKKKKKKKKHRQNYFIFTKYLFLSSRYRFTKLMMSFQDYKFIHFTWTHTTETSSLWRNAFPQTSYLATHFNRKFIPNNSTHSHKFSSILKLHFRIKSKMKMAILKILSTP